MKQNELIANVGKIHTTEMGVNRIKKNAEIDVPDVILWCRQRILSPSSLIERKGKNFYVQADGVVLTVNASSFTVITAHKTKKR